MTVDECIAAAGVAGLRTTDCVHHGVRTTEIIAGNVMNGHWCTIKSWPKTGMVFSIRHVDARVRAVQVEDIPHLDAALQVMGVEQ